MKKINKYNEFVNIDTDKKSLIIQLIEESESTNIADLEEIAQKESYRKIVEIGEETIPFLLKRNTIIWDRALKEITGDGLDNLKYSTKERKKYWQDWSIKNGY